MYVVIITVIKTYLGFPIYYVIAALSDAEAFCPMSQFNDCCVVIVWGREGAADANRETESCEELQKGFLR